LAHEKKLLMTESPQSNSPISPVISGMLLARIGRKVRFQQSALEQSVFWYMWKLAPNSPDPIGSVGLFESHSDRSFA
jgi:hypothetical protein